MVLCFEKLILRILSPMNISFVIIVLFLFPASVEVLTGLSGDKMSSCLHRLCLGSAQRLTQVATPKPHPHSHSLADNAE